MKEEVEEEDGYCHKPSNKNVKTCHNNKSKNKATITLIIKTISNYNKANIKNNK